MRFFFGSENGDATKFRIVAKLAASPLFEEALRRMLTEKKAKLWRSLHRNTHFFHE